MGKIKSPLVSVYCLTYNHKDYIAKAIDSFLMQKTNFDFEIEAVLSKIATYGKLSYYFSRIIQKILIRLHLDFKSRVHRNSKKRTFSR
jgi:glycosyltransferase involved in cell wall biosynthesis